MEIKEFIERFSGVKFVWNFQGYIEDYWNMYYRNNFGKSLENYTNLVCKKQRENCCKNAVDNFAEYSVELEVDTILNAEMPKIEELLEL